MKDTFRLGIIFTHPTQHHAPLWKKLNEQPGISVSALYLSAENQVGGDRQLGSSQAWDVDLVSGYQFEYLKTLTGKISDKATKSLLNPGLLTRLTRENFDAVWLSNFTTYSYRLAFLLCKLRGIPIMSQNDATIITDDRYKYGRRILQSILYPWMFRLSDYWIPIGDHNVTYLRHYGVADEKMVRGCYPFDRQRFELTIEQNADEIDRIRHQLRWDNHTIVFGFAGKYIDRKQPFEFIEGIAKAHQKNPRIRGVTIGGGELAEAIENRIAAMNGEVLNLGFINQSKLPLYYAAMDGFVSTSHTDPHPLVISEAMTAGCPVILSDRCGNWGYSDIVQHRYNGLVYPCGNSDALAEAMLTIADPSVRATYSQHAKEVVANQDLNCTLNAVMEIIARIKQQNAKENRRERMLSAPAINCDRSIRSQQY